MTNGNNSTLYVLYGSATGNAEGISKDLTAELNDNKETRLPAPFKKAVCWELNQFKKCLKEWEVAPSNEGEKYGALIVSSTTGNGDPPENAGRFNRFIKKQSRDKSEPKPFEHVAYSVLALGDTNYDQFCATGALIDKKMAALGGTRARKLVCADEGTGLLEETVEPWMATIAQDVAKACLVSVTEATATTATSTTTSTTTTTAVSAGEEKVDTSSNTDEAPASTKNATTDSPAANNVPETSTATADPVVNSAEESPASAAEVTAAPEKSPTPLYILYASATGNAEAISKDLAATYEVILNNPDSKTYFPEVVCAELNQFKKLKLLETWSKPPVPGNDSIKHGILVVASTTGNGDAPENSDRFLRYLKKTAKAGGKPLEHVAFAMLGLGDTNYDQYCEHAKVLNKKMQELGGSMIRPLACADEGTGQLEEVVEGWTGSILMELTLACKGEAATIPAVAKKTNKPISETTPVMVKKEKKVVHQEEEKKIEAFEDVYKSSSPTSLGVLMVRSLLSSDDDITTGVDSSTVPKSSLKSHVTSVEFVSDNVNDTVVTSAEADDDQSEDGIHYTLDQPFDSTIVGARYLTATSSEAANEICETSSASAQDVLDRRFPLQIENDVTEASRNGKRVIELALALPDDQSWEYQPGDSLGLIVTNTPEAVDFVLSMLQSHHGISPSQKVSIDSGVPLTVEEILREKIDLCTVMKSRKVMFALSQISNDPHERAVLELLSSKTDRGSELMETFVHAQRRSVVDILREFPSCQSITLQSLVDLLPPIPPRYYSVSSSPLDKGRTSSSLTVTFSVVDYLTPSLLSSSDGKELGLRRIHGVATSHLEALCAPFLSSPLENKAAGSSSCFKIFQKPTEEFHLPTDFATPLVLIGPGTGIAPFMGFLAHRKALTALAAAAAEGESTSTSTSTGTGSVEVFFGCRHADHDYLYREELQAFQNDDVIDHMNTAFSRDNVGKKEYVQDIMIGNADCSKRLADTIVNGNGTIYVCGDGNHMGRDVQATIAKLLGPHLVSPDETSADEMGKAYIENMKSEGRFLLDIWS